MIEILYFMPILLSAFAIGNFIFKFFKLKTTYLEESIFSIVLGFAFYSYLTFFFGVLGWLYAWVYWIIILFSLLLWHKLWVRFLKSIFGSIKSFKPKFNFETFLIITIAIFVILAVLSTLVPPFLWDEMDYRLAHPKIWARHHELTPILSRWFTEFPSNIDVLYIIGFLIKNAITAKLFALTYNLLLAAAIYSFGKRFYGQNVALLSASIFFSLPMVMSPIGSAYVDIPVASAVFLAFYSFTLWWAENKDNSWIYLSAILTGVSLASKYTAVIPAFILGIFLLYFACKKNGFYFMAKKMLIFSIIVFAMTLPWTLKAYFRTANPIWPFFYDFLGGNYWDSSINSYFFQKLDDAPFSNLWGFILYPWNITMHSSNFSLLLGWNAVFLAFVPLLIFYKKIEKITKYLLSYSIIFLYLVIPSAFIFFGIMRYLLVYPALSIISAVVISDLIKDKSLKKPMIVMIIATFAFTAALWGAIFAQKMPYVFGMESESSFYGKLADYNGYPVFDYINNNLPQSSIIFFFRETRGYLSDRDYIVALPNEQKIIDYNVDYENFYNQLKKLGATHMLVNENVGFYKPQIEVKNRKKPFSVSNEKMMQDLLSKKGALLFEKDGVSVYKLK